jgi:hypothetical protein
MFSRCAVQDCGNGDVQIHHIRRLGQRKSLDSAGKTTTVISRSGKRIKGLAAIMSAMNRKQLPLCPKHHSLFEQGIYSDLDAHYCKQLLLTNIPDGDKLRSAFDTGSYFRTPK